MPRQPNYGFDKRRKEQERKAKKDAKKAERQLRREERSPTDPATEDPGTAAPLPPDETA